MIAVLALLEPSLLPPAERSVLVALAGLLHSTVFFKYYCWLLTYLVWSRGTIFLTYRPFYF